MLSGIAAPLAQAAAVNWAPDADGFWNVPANWNPAPPTAADDVTINVAGVRTITHNSGTDTIRTLTNAETVLILGGSTLNISLGGTNTGFLTAGGASAGTLNLNGGTLTNTGGVLTAANGGLITQNGTTITGGTINTAGSGVFRATSNGNNILNNVTLTGVLDVASGSSSNRRERIVNGLTLNSGSINIANGGILSLDSTLGANQTIGGSGGTINLNDAGARLAIEGTGTTTLGANIVVRGQGNIGQPLFAGGTNTLVNNGRISADVAGTLSITNPANSGSLTNNNILEAKTGGTLALSTNVNNSSGQINAQNTGVVLHNGTTITGGTINTAGSGVFRASSNGNNILNNVTLTGVADLTTVVNSRERIVNGLTLNSGNINIANGGILSLDSTSVANQTIGGSGGTINLNDAGARLAIEGNGTTTLGANIVVRGQGNIGQPLFAGGTNTLVNNGRISADVSGGTLNIVNPANSGSLTNNGILEAVGGGTLLLSTNVTANTGSQISAGAGSSVVQNGVTISGVINTSGGGLFTASNSGNNILDGVTLNGVLDVASGASSNRRERVINGLTLNGAVNIANGGILSLDSNSTPGGAQTINGTGVINLNDAAARLTMEGNGSTTLGAGLTVRGQGNIGGPAIIAGGNNTLINNGLISADVSGGTLNIVPPANGGSLTNNGILEAKTGGTLALSTNVNNSSGQINAQNTGVVLHNGTTITGGTINTAGSGVFRASSNGNNILNNVTLTGVADLTTVVNSRERIINGATINGVVNIANGGILSLDSNSTPGGAQTINGTGVINLNDAAARLTMEGNGSTTLGAGLTVRGQGNIGGPAIIAGGNNTLINNGLISADVSGGTLNIVPPANGGSLTNNGTLRASNGGTLTVSSALTNLSGTTLTGGTYEVIAGAGTANMRLPNANIVTNAATILLDGANSNLLNNNTSGNALLNLATNATTTTPGSFTIQNGRNFTTAGAFTNNVLGTVTVGNASTFNSTGAFTNNGILAMRGGTFNAPSLSSSGQVNGNGTITPNIANSGLVLSNGGTLTAVNGITGSGGFDTVVSNPGSTLAIGAASTASLLVNNGNLALGANNITVGGVYDNANFGTGNSFDRRANVTGTGLILASGATPGAAQTLAGNIVGGGPTSGNATMNFGNIRVGSSSTLNYQIGNANSGGPSLTGAIQTAVNGGNISDVRLSGSGVTASNWGPIADGANTGNLGVTFTATSAGALTGQQVHIRNNFDNTNAQNLVITGAAFNLASGNTTPSPVVFGNAHVGDIRTQVLTISNTAPTGAFTEGLNASFGATTGNVSNNGGSVSLLAGGASNNTNLAVTLDTSAAGARSGSATLNYVSDGAGTSGLGTTSVGSQTINVSGNVYRLALANDIGDINFGSVLVGSTQTRTVSISNLAAADGFSEALNAAFGTIGGTNPGQFSVAGLINQLAAGANDNASMVVTLNTGSAGTYSANVQILLNSDGTGTSGLGITALPTQVINLDGIVTGTVGNLAQAGPHSPEPVNFGNVRIGSTQNQTLSIQNTASGPAEGLNASISSNTPGVVTASGAFMNLAPQATNNTDLVVGLNTLVAGARSGTATISLESDGSFNSGTTTALPSQTVNVSGNVYRLASPTLNTTSVTLAARVGDAAPSANLSVTNSSPDSFTEGLNVTRGSTASGFTSSGSVSNLVAGGTNGSGIQVSLNTGTAGSFSGTQALNFVSTGAGTTGEADVSVGSALVNLAGKVYQQAVAQVNTTLVNFGIVHRGDTVTPVAVSVTNSAPVAGLNDMLRGSLGGASGPFNASGNLGTGVAAGATDSSSLSVGLDTSATGVFNGTATASLASHNADMADLIIAGIPVNLSAQVNDFANADLRKTGGDGSLSRSALTIVLDFGTLIQGSGARTASLDVFNNVAGPADLLDGQFTLLDTDDFLFSGFNPFSNLAAGDSQGGLSVAFDALTLGSFSDTILLASLVGHNASGYSGSLPDITFRILASVIANDGNIGTVPEPESLLLMAIGMLALMAVRRRRVTLH